MCSKGIIKRGILVAMSIMLLVGCSSKTASTNGSQKKDGDLFKKQINNITLAEMKIKTIPAEISKDIIESIINPKIDESGILVTERVYSEPSSAMVKSDNDMVGGIKLPLKIKAEGSEEQMEKFLELLSKVDSKFTIASLDVNKPVDNYILDMEIVFYSTQSIAEINADMNIGSVSKIENYKEEDTSVKLRTYDFIGMIRPMISDISAVRFGVTRNNAFCNMIYDNRNEIVTVNLELTQQGKKYFYKYYTDDSGYPKDGLVEEFKPNGNEILVDILSCERYNKDDNVGINLVVKNKTDKKVDIMVHNDDPHSRVTKAIQ